MQSHFTWDLKLEDLGTEEQGEDQEPEQEREVSHCYSFLAYVRYRTEAVSAVGVSDVFVSLTNSSLGTVSYTTQVSNLFFQ